MDGKPMHYDGSVQNENASIVDSLVNERFTLTDEMRMNINGNPYMMDKTQ